MIRGTKDEVTTEPPAVWGPVDGSRSARLPAPPGSVPDGGDGGAIQELLRHPQMWGFATTTASTEFVRGALFISLLPAYLSRDLGWSVSAIGMVVSGQYLADTFFKIPSGWLVDRFGPWRVLLPFLAAAALPIYFLARVHSVAGLLLLSILFGLGTSANWPASLSGSVHLAGLRRRAQATSVIFLAWLCAGGMGPVLINFLSANRYRAAFDVIAGVITVAPVVALLGSSGVLHRRDDPPWHRIPAGQTMGDVWEHVGRMGWLIPGMFVQMLVLGMLLPIMAPYAQLQLHLSGPMYGVLLATGGAFTVIFLLPVGHLVDRTDSKAMLVAGFALAAVSVILVGTASGLGSLLWRVPLLGLSYALILPAWNSLTVGKISAERRGLLLGVFMAIEGLGIAVGPALGGALYTYVNFRTPFLVAAAILAAIALFYLVVPRERFRSGQGA